MIVLFLISLAKFRELLDTYLAALDNALELLTSLQKSNSVNTAELEFARKLPHATFSPSLSAPNKLSV